MTDALPEPIAVTPDATKRPPFARVAPETDWQMLVALASVNGPASGAGHIRGITKMVPELQPSLVHWAL